MEKVKAFFHVFTSSLLPHQPYYHKLLKTKFKFSLKYFLILSIFTYIFFYSIYAVKFGFFQNFALATSSFTKSLNSFPSDLVITINNGKLTTNYNRPYFMWMDVDQNKTLLLVVDESATPDSIKNYNSYALFTNDSIITKSYREKDRYVVNEYEEDNIIINKAKVNEFNNLFQQTISSLYVIIPIILLFVLPVVMIFINFFYLLLTSIIVHFFAKYHFKGITLKKTLQISFHAFTLPLIANYALGIISPKLAILPVTFFALTFLFLSFAIHECHYVVSPRHKS